jgi:hypothetical protein
MLPIRLDRFPVSHDERVKLTKGFILNKLYSFGYVGGKHTAIENLSRSCPPELSQHLSEATKELRGEGLLRAKPTSYGEQVSAVAHQVGYEYANVFREYARLPKVKFGQPASKQGEVPPLSPEELRALKLRKHKM